MSNLLPTINKNQKTVILSITGVLIIVEVITGLLGELMPDDFKDMLIAKVGKENYKYAWAALLAFTVLGLIWLTSKKEGKEEGISVDYERGLREKIIDSLLQRYKERHKQKLDDRIELNLELKYTSLGTEEAYVEKFFASEAKTQKDLKEKLAAVLEKHHFLLIVGEPGAGKTTILLELAIELLEKAQAEKNAPIPLIFNLSSWNENFSSFGDWLKDVLVQGNGFSKDFAKSMVDNNLILPLLDGLDELGSNSGDTAYQKRLRNNCLRTLEDFMEE